MTGGDTNPCMEVVYSTPSVQAVADFVSTHFAVSGPVTCVLLRRGFNDTFEVRAKEGFRAVLRLSGRRTRGEADVATETAFLAYLDKCGIPVAAPIPTRDGNLHATVCLPEGKRPAVLFKFVEGREPDIKSPIDARAHGIALARIHDAANGFVNGEPERYKLDLDHLLLRPTSEILKVDILGDATRAEYAALANRLTQQVTEIQGLTWTRCHGDCHGGNARIAGEGPLAGRAVFFDFDDGGFGYLAYDLAVFLWARVSFGRKGTAPWHSFIDGYRSVRSIAAKDFEAVHPFVMIRHIWLLGEYAGRRHEWGNESVPAKWIAGELEFLRSWEVERVSSNLFIERD